MLICICNSINCEAVNEAIQDGASTAKDVFKQCGTKPQCKQCLEAMKKMIDFKKV